MPTTSHVTSVERAMDILSALDVSPRGLSVSEIGRKLSIPKSSAHVIVVSLERSGYVVRIPGSRNYTLSLKVYGLGREMLQNLALPQVALSPMRWLAAKTGLTIHLAILEGCQAIYIQKVDGPGLIRFDTFVGKRTNLHCTSVGKVLLAYSPSGVRDKFLSKSTFARYTSKTIASGLSLRCALDTVREQGYAFDDEEEELEIRCVSVPVFKSNEVVAALGMTGIASQLPATNATSFVTLAKRAVSYIYEQPTAAEMPTPAIWPAAKLTRQTLAMLG